MVKYVRCGNAGENTKQLREACEEEMGIILEFTAAYTPEQNEVVEGAFATVRNRWYAMMLNANFSLRKGYCHVKPWMLPQDWQT